MKIFAPGGGGANKSQKLSTSGDARGLTDSSVANLAIITLLCSEAKCTSMKASD